MFNRPEFAREMRRGEEAAVDDLLRAAFGGEEEVRLVHKLRKSKAIAGEQVLPMGGDIVGYYALCRMVAPKGWLCLAPVAITPALQRQGHGRRMIGMLTEWARLTQSPIVVLGDPRFYTRAGFSDVLAGQVSGPYPAQDTMIAGVSAAPQAKLIYPPAFD